MAINDLVIGAELGPEFEPGTTVPNMWTIRVDGVTLMRDAATGELSAVAEDAAGTGYTPTAPLTGTDVQTALDELAAQLAGVQHTIITGIDLQSTGNLNEYTVVVQWTDGTGATHTSTDPTPLRIAGVGASTDPGNLITNGADGGSFFDGPALKQAVIDHVLTDQDLVSTFGTVLGTVQGLQP